MLFEHTPSGGFGDGSSMPISFNLASVWTPRARTAARPTRADARRNMLSVARVVVTLALQLCVCWAMQWSVAVCRVGGRCGALRMSRGLAHRILVEKGTAVLLYRVTE